jgi:hypothetical protein
LFHGLEIQAIQEENIISWLAKIHRIFFIGIANNKVGLGGGGGRETNGVYGLKFFVKNYRQCNTTPIN